MTYLTIIWALLTLPVFLIGMAVMGTTNRPDYVSDAFVSLFIFMPAWWSAYFLIRWFGQ